MVSGEVFKFVSEFVHRKAAIVLEPGKEYLVESRLRPLATELGMASIDDLVGRLRATNDAEIGRRVIDAMTTNETSFFRDIHPWETLRTQVLPELIAARATTRTLRIWCAAASTGQEPYTVALTMANHFPELQSWNLQFLATDINESVLTRAKNGRYSQLEMNRGMPAALLVKYFNRIGLEWELKPEVRRMVTFQQLNLLDRWPVFGQLDLVFIRNVLIYFDTPTKRSLFSRIRQVLRPDGYLVLGGAETTLNIDDELGAVRRGGSVFFQVRANNLGKVANGSGQ